MTLLGHFDAGEKAGTPFAMFAAEIRNTASSDLPRPTEIHNYYVLNSSITFDVNPRSVEQRTVSFDQLAETGSVSCGEGTLQ